jgi:hypothetical protein
MREVSGGNQRHSDGDDRCGVRSVAIIRGNQYPSVSNRNQSQSASPDRVTQSVPISPNQPQSVPISPNQPQSAAPDRVTHAQHDQTFWT